MYLQFSTKNFKNQYVVYTITDDQGRLIHVGVTEFTNLTNLSGIKFSEEVDQVYLNVVKMGENRMKLAEWAIGNFKAFQQELLAEFKSWSHGNKHSGHPIMCVETGQKWASLKACALDQNLSYSQLINHVKGAVGYKSVKGKTYRKAQ